MLPTYDNQEEFKALCLRAPDYLFKIMKRQFLVALKREVESLNMVAYYAGLKQEKDIQEIVTILEKRLLEDRKEQLQMKEHIGALKEQIDMLKQFISEESSLHAKEKEVSVFLKSKFH